MSDEVAPDIFRTQLPLPRNPLRSVNSYIIVGEFRTLIVDTGMNRPECLHAIIPVLEALDLDLTRTDVLVTHLHADHLGLAPVLTKGGSRVYMGRQDIESIGERDYWSNMFEFAVQNGFPQMDPLEALRKHPGYKYGPLGDMAFQPLYGGELLKYGGRHLETIHTPGHTAGHMCLFDIEENILFSGDLILGDITPNISLWSWEGDPLSDYMASLGIIREMDIDLVLTGHRSFVRDHRRRIDELLKHHEERASEVMEILGDRRMNGMEIASQMTWDMTYNSFDEFPMIQKWFALGEALAHIRYLENLGRIGVEQNESRLKYFCR